MQFTLQELLAIVGAMIASAGVATGVVKWLLDGRQQTAQRVDDQFQALQRGLPKDYVPRQELNGRLTAINATMQQGFATQHEALTALKTSLDAVHARGDQVLQTPAPRAPRRRA